MGSVVLATLEDGLNELVFITDESFGQGCLLEGLVDHALHCADLDPGAVGVLHQQEPQVEGLWLRHWHLRKCMFFESQRKREALMAIIKRMEIIGT